MKKLLTTLLSLMLVAMPLSVFAQTSTNYSASMSFSGVTGNTVALGENFTVDVIVDTGGQDVSVIGSTVTFDATKLEYVSKVYPGVGGDGYLPMAYGPSQLVGADGLNHLVMTRSIDATTTPPSAPANGADIFAKLTFRPLGAVGTNFVLDFYFLGTGESVDSNVILDGVSPPIDILGVVNPTTYTVGVGNPVGNDPVINSISPTSGNQNIAQNITISGANFGATQGNGWVHIGTKTATIINWADNQIMITVPAEGDITASSTRQIKVHREDGKEATYSGYRYLVTPLVPTGPEELMWAGIILAALGMSILAYRKMNYVAEAQTSISSQDLANIMPPQETKDEDNISYRF